MEIGATDYHTAGEPFRIVEAAALEIPGATVRARREYALVPLLHPWEGSGAAGATEFHARRQRGLGAAARHANTPWPLGVAASAKRPRGRATTRGRSRSPARGARREDIVLLVGAGLG